MHFFQNFGLEPDILYHQLHLTGESFPSHFHRAYEILVVQAGTLALTVEEHTEQLVPGDCGFIFSNQIHSFQAQADTELAVLILSPELLPDFHQQVQQQVPLTNRLPAAARKRQLPAAMSLFQMKAWAYDLCHHLLTTCEFKPALTTTSGELLPQMLSWLMTHYQEPVTLQQLALQLNYDYKYLSKLFIQKTGMGFNDYLNYLRISQARDLLANTQLAIAEIAHQCGYESLRTFNRNYRKVCGQPPSAQRQS